MREMMVYYIISMLNGRSNLHAKPVLAKNFNIPSGAKPDIHVFKGGIEYYMDVGFSNNGEQYAKAKTKKYKDSPKKVDLIIF